MAPPSRKEVKAATESGDASGVNAGGQECLRVAAQRKKTGALPAGVGEGRRHAATLARTERGGDVVLDEPSRLPSVVVSVPALSAWRNSSCSR
jgi:hypothetical protein